MRRNKIILIAVALLLLSGCHTAVEDSSPSPSPTPVVTPTPAPTPTPTPTPTPSPTTEPTPRSSRTPRPTPEPTLSVDLFNEEPDELPYVPEGPILRPEDIIVDGIPLLDSGDRIREKYGEPVNIEEYESWEDGSIYYVWYYDFGWVCLFERNDGSLIWTDMLITTPTISAPRDICVGDSVDEILSSFPNHNEYQDEEMTIFYRYNTGSTRQIAVPPSGRMWLNDDGSSTYLFNYPKSLLGYKMPMEYLEEDYIYNLMVDIRYTVRDGIIQEIQISYGAYGE